MHFLNSPLPLWCLLSSARDAGAPARRRRHPPARQEGRRRLEPQGARAKPKLPTPAAAHLTHLTDPVQTQQILSLTSAPRTPARITRAQVDLAMEELGVKPPSVATRAVCRAWFRLRLEVSQLLDVRVPRKRLAFAPICALPVSLALPP